MRAEWRLHRFVLSILVVLLAAFTGFGLHLRPMLEHPRVDAIGALMIVAVAASLFFTMGIIAATVALQFEARHRRELMTYGVLGLISIALGIYLAWPDNAGLPEVALAAAPQAFLFALGELRLARHLKHHPALRRSLRVGGVAEAGLGVVLVYSGARPAGWSSAEIVNLLIYGAVISLLQLLPLVLYRVRAGAAGAV
jgi:hypothetical protein